MKRIFISLAIFSLGVGATLLYVRENDAAHTYLWHKCEGGRRFESFGRGSLERLKVRGVKALTHLETRLSGQITENPKQAAKLQPLCSAVTALKDKFSALDTVQPVDVNFATEGAQRKIRKMRYAEGSIEAIQARGVRILTMLELMVVRRIDSSDDQSEEMLKSLNSDIVALKQKFQGLHAAK